MTCPSNVTKHGIRLLHLDAEILLSQIGIIVLEPEHFVPLGVSALFNHFCFICDWNLLCHWRIAPQQTDDDV